mgnify:CR=1 FL=1
MLDADLGVPVIDLRDGAAFYQCHLSGACHLPWPDLTTQLNALPPRPAQLQLVGDAPGTLQQAAQFLSDKGYVLPVCVQWAKLIPFRATRPHAFRDHSSDSKRLWSPSAGVHTWLKHYLSATARDKEAQSQRPSLGFKALDLGCGGGRDAVFLAQHGVKVVAVDQQSRVLQRARALAAHALSPDQQNAIDWQCHNVTHWIEQPPAFRSQFSLIVMARFLERRLFQHLDQWLQPGGYVLIDTFCYLSQSDRGPKNPRFILQKDELVQSFSHFRIITDKMTPLKDGLVLQTFIAQKPEISDEKEFRSARDDNTAVI